LGESTLIWTCLGNLDEQLAVELYPKWQIAKLMLILFQAESTFFFDGLCNPDEQPAPRLCGTSLQSFKNNLIFPGKVYFLFGLVSAILMSNLLPNYVAPFSKLQ
jgi:hypothetical protein